MNTVLSALQFVCLSLSLACLTRELLEYWSDIRREPVDLVLHRTESDHSSIYLVELAYLSVTVVGLDSFRVPESSRKRSRSVLFILQGMLTFTMKVCFPNHFEF